jgi:peptide deformylase
MAILKIITVGEKNEEILRKPAARVRNFDAKLHRLLGDMLETMRAAPGIGLAGPQVGVNQRVIVLEYPEDEENPEETMRTYALINPEIIRVKGMEVGQEGCLSLPGLAADVERATYVLVRAQDRYGKEFRIKAYDLLARIIQHEVDHLHGVLMTDKARQLYKLRKREDGEVEAIPIEQAMAEMPMLHPEYEMGRFGD